MENLTKTQLVMLVLLVSFVTSLVTGIVTASLVSQAPAPFTQSISRVIEKIVPSVTENNNNQQAAPLVIQEPSKEELTIKVIKNVSNSVVSVVASKDIPVIEQYYINPFQNDPLFKDLLPDVQIPQYRQNGTQKTQVSSGTGFFISKDGLLLTNKHVVEDTKADYSIVTNSGKKFDAKVLARDPFLDLAILKITSTSTENNFVPIPLGDSDGISIGQSAIAIGNALGEFTNTVSVGIISGLNRSVTAEGSASGPEQLSDLIQTDAAINPGNSGGPLLDLNGKVIGINVARSQSGENIGFALPINMAKRDVSDAVDFGDIKYPYLGVKYQVVDKGLKLTEVSGPSDKAGLKAGDIIEQLNNNKLDSQATLNYLLSKLRVGDKIILKVLRDGKEMTVTITLEERPANL